MFLWAASTSVKREKVSRETFRRHELLICRDSDSGASACSPCPNDAAQLASLGINGTEQCPNAGASSQNGINVTALIASLSVLGGLILGGIFAALLRGSDTEPKTKEPELPAQAEPKKPVESMRFHQPLQGNESLSSSSHSGVILVVLESSGLVLLAHRDD
jgi:hypothetical protein